MPQWILTIILVVSFQGFDYEIIREVYHKTKADCNEQKELIYEIMTEQEIDSDIKSITCDLRREFKI